MRGMGRSVLSGETLKIVKPPEFLFSVLVYGKDEHCEETPTVLQAKPPSACVCLGSSLGCWNCVNSQRGISVLLLFIRQIFSEKVYFFP